MKKFVTATILILVLTFAAQARGIDEGSLFDDGGFDRSFPTAIVNDFSDFPSEAENPPPDDLPMISAPDDVTPDVSGDESAPADGNSR